MATTRPLFLRFYKYTLLTIWVLQFTWILAAAYPVIGDDGLITGVTGTLTDIS